MSRFGELIASRDVEPQGLLGISIAQMQALGEARRAAFHELALARARRFFPAQYERMGDVGMASLLRSGVERAGRHGIVGERDVARYLDVMLVFGSDFGVEQAWAAEILAAPHEGGPAEAAFLLLAEATMRAEGHAAVLARCAADADTLAGTPLGGCVEGPTTMNYVGFELVDEAGFALSGEYVLEHPDGTLDLGRFHRGMLYRSDVPKGEYRVHLPSIVEASWAPGGGGVVVRHRGYRAGTEATVVIYAALGDGAAAPIAEILVPLAGDDQRLLEEQETRAAWAPEPRPGAPSTLCTLTFGVTIDGSSVDCVSPLILAPFEAPSP